MLQLLETFCTVAETGSLSKAAEALHLTQPAVTRKIKALEHELGAVLLTRTPHGVELTPVGREVLIHAHSALAAVAACRRAAAKSTPAGKEQLRIATGSMLMQFVVPPVLAALRRERPDLHIEIHTGSYRECLDRLVAYNVDLALIFTPQIPPGLKARPLFTDPMAVVTAPGNPLTADRKERSIAELDGLSLLALPRTAGLHQQLVKVLDEHGIRCELVEQATVESIKTMVALEMGITLLPRSAVADEVAQGRLAAVPLKDWPDNGRTVLAVTRGEGEVPEPVTAFIRALRERYGNR